MAKTRRTTRSAPAEPELLREMMELMRDQQAQQARLVQSLMEAHTAQAQVFQSWLDMFKPQATPLKGTSPDERAAIREASEAAEWDAMIPEIARAMLRGEDLPNG
jgi:hypothetical protein